MSSPSSSSSSSSSCQLCMSSIEVFSVGECNHPICHVCSTKMRVICQQKECALCRTHLNKVVFTKNMSVFSEVENNPYQMDRKSQICFENKEIKAQYMALLAHRCPICEGENIFNIFPTFSQLERHVRREHQRHYCELCHENLQLFSSERRIYTRQELVSHRRKDHPECSFCKERFFDRDGLFSHCRREHFSCHVCDKNGGQNIFKDYSALRKHFSKEHHLCRDPACEEQKFVVFENEIDLRAHQVTEHRASRNIPLDFTGQAKSRTRDKTKKMGNVPDLEKDFPQIQGADNSRVFTLTSWSKKINHPTTAEEEFPSLFVNRLKSKRK